MRHPHDPARHHDELRIVEDHRQTAQKLTLYRGYVGPWGNILANAKLARPVTELFYLDTHCGAGRHASREHPDGGVIGSPLIACHEARRLQRRYPNLTVHVRAVDNDERWIRHLRKRVQPFLTCNDPRDRVDVQLFPEPFETMLPKLLAEVNSYDAPSLWFIDPDGIKIPYEVVRLLQKTRKGRPEVVINLDMLGMWRVDAAARDRVDERFENIVLGDYDAQCCLNELFGGREVWDPVVGSGREPIFDRTQSLRNNVPRLAAAYAELFPRFEFRSHYPLLATGGQMREIIHLTHSSLGKEKFYGAYIQSQDFGLLSAGRLDLVARAHAARRYWQAYHGETTVIDQLYQEGTQPWNRAEIRSICVTGDEERYGRYDERAGTMRWFVEREPDPTDETYQPTLF